MRPTLAFATMCKNEEHCILNTLNSVAPYIDYLLVCDTGSTDRTVEIVQQFMEDTGIPGEIIHDVFEGFGPTKTRMMEAVYGKTDYVLHVDSDDVLMGEFDFNNRGNYDAYFMTMTKGNSDVTYLATVIYNNRLRWKFCGVAHTTIKCLDRENFSIGEIKDGYVCCDSVGARSFDPEKYLKDAKKLKKQFFETLYDDPDNLNARSVFYTAQSYMDYGDLNKAIEWYSLYLHINNTWVEERFESLVRIARCLIQLGRGKDEVLKQLNRAIDLFPDRAEPYYFAGEYLLYREVDCQLAYDYLSRGRACSLENAKSKYVLFIQDQIYGLAFNDNLSVACSYIGKYEEGLQLVKEIINLPEYQVHRERLTRNLEFFENKLVNEKI